jgi:hypothetical protein
MADAAVAGRSALAEGHFQGQGGPRPVAQGCGTKRCLANGIQTCGADGSWGGTTDCAVQACVDGACVGGYMLRANQPGLGNHVANCGYIVATDATRRGVARAMCAHSLDRARECGFTAMQFNFVISSNERADSHKYDRLAEAHDTSLPGEEQSHARVLAAVKSRRHRSRRTGGSCRDKRRC